MEQQRPVRVPPHAAVGLGGGGRAVGFSHSHLSACGDAQAGDRPLVLIGFDGAVQRLALSAEEARAWALEMLRQADLAEGKLPCAGAKH